MADSKDTELIAVASAAVEAYTRVSELPYFFSPDSSEHEPMLLALRAAYQLGADQELEACCEVLARELICDGKHVATDLRKIRRPKPPSLKQQALSLIDNCTDPEGDYLDDNALSIIRRALEQIND